MQSTSPSQRDQAASKAGLDLPGRDFLSHALGLPSANLQADDRRAGLDAVVVDEPLLYGGRDVAASRVDHGLELGAVESFLAGARVPAVVGVSPLFRPVAALDHVPADTGGVGEAAGVVLEGALAGRTVKATSPSVGSSWPGPG